MRYYKIIDNGYITAIGCGNDGIEVTEEEFDSLLAIIQARPIPKSGFDYRLKSDLTWELYELPPIVVDENRELSDSEALEIILGGSV